MIRYGYYRIFAGESDKETASIRTELIGNGVASNNIYKDVRPQEVNESDVFKKLLGKLKQGDELYCPSLSRLAVNTDDLLEVLRLLNSKDIRLVAYKDSFDSTAIFGDLMQYVLQIIKNFIIECRKEEVEDTVDIAEEQKQSNENKRYLFLVDKLDEITRLSKEILSNIEEPKVQKKGKEVLKDNINKVSLIQAEQLTEKEKAEGEDKRYTVEELNDIVKQQIEGIKKDVKRAINSEEPVDADGVELNEIRDEYAVEEAIKKDLRKLADEEDKTLETDKYKEKIREGYQEQEETEGKEIRVKDEKVSLRDMLDVASTVKHKTPANVFNETDIPHIWNKQLNDNATLRASIDDISRLALGEGSVLNMHTSEEEEASAKIARDRIERSQPKEWKPQIRNKDEVLDESKERGEVKDGVRNQEETKRVEKKVIVSEKKEQLKQDKVVEKKKSAVKSTDYAVNSDNKKYVELIENAKDTTEAEKEALKLYLLSSINSESLYGPNKGISKGRFYKLLDGLGIPRRSKQVSKGNKGR